MEVVANALDIFGIASAFQSIRKFFSNSEGLKVVFEAPEPEVEYGRHPSFAFCF